MLIKFPKVCHSLRIVLLATSGLIVSAAVAGEPVTITLQVNDDAPIVIEQDYTDASYGSFSYVGDYTDPGGQWSATWNYWINPDPVAGASISGSSRILNTSTAEARFLFMIESPLCPRIENESLMGAFVVVSIDTDANGGMMSDFDGQSIWAMLADGQVAETMFDAPFLLGSSGQGGATFTGSVGAPFPSRPSGPIHESAGLRHHFRMTGGEMATFSTSLSILGEQSNASDCHLLGDINADGVVDLSDALFMFHQWGQCPECAADLNDDDLVNVGDLMILLQNWG